MVALIGCSGGLVACDSVVCDDQLEILRLLVDRRARSAKSM